MDITKIKDRYQITIPKEIRRELGCSIGDLMEVKLQEGRVILTPQKLFRKPSAVKLNSEEQQMLKLAQAKLENIDKDFLNSEGLTKDEIDVGIKVGLIDPEEAWWYAEEWQKAEREASKDEIEGETSEAFDKEGLMKRLTDIRKKA